MSKTILVVDDSPSIRQLLSFTLKERGYTVLEAGNGQEALAKLAGGKINLIVCDVNMPEMDGITFVKTVKTDAAYSDFRFTPVIMLTTETGEDRKIEGRDAGVKAWITKPFAPDKLISAIEKLII
ncbi:MAG: response regulator [Spirochaetes bacterium]|nr:MAG: response regulator [Spirochaetota bacterium]